MGFLHTQNSNSIAGLWTRSIRFLLLSLLLSAALFSTSCVAQKARGALTLDDCVQMARKAPSSVQRARQQLESTKFGVRGARANFLPQISILNSFTYNSPLLYNPNAFSFVAFNGVHEYSSLANTTLEVDSSGRLRAIYDRAQANRKIAQADVVLSERDLRLAVALAYYRVVLSRRLANSAEDNLRAARDFEDRVRKLVDGGEASQADLSKASLESALLERTAQAIKLGAEVANHDLASYWTEDVATPLVVAEGLDDALPPPTAPPAENSYLKRPEFQLFSAQIAGYRADARQARARMLPQLNLAFDYGFDSNHVTSRDRGYAGFVHFDIPVFDFLRARSEQRVFQSQALQAETIQNIGRRIFSKEYQDALSSVRGIYAQIGVAEQQVKLAGDNLRLSRLRYEGGEGLALDVVTAQSAQVQAQIDFYTARANYLNAQSALKVASGQ